MVIVWLGTVLLWLIGGFANGSNPGSPAVMIGLAVGFWGIVLIGIAWFVARLTAPLERRTCPGCGRAVDAGRESCASCGHRIGHGALPRHSA
ncbi:MAG TPA: hypothetical protein VMA83_01200 [Solirubrobacteraceae bacterium]|nr:hypothetical protein [Solirubrobacteraceae bacterium]